MIAIIDYNTGNLYSVKCALDRLEAEYTITDSAEEILRADSVILPGVGEASSAMANLAKTGLDSLIPALKIPVLGICIGMQLMCRSSAEGHTECMGIFNNQVNRLEGDSIKVPHMGWNSVSNLKTALFEGIDDGAYLYFVHSYAPTLDQQTTIAISNYGSDFSSALCSENFFGTQFHPEKSGQAGERILKNFINIKFE